MNLFYEVCNFVNNLFRDSLSVQKISPCVVLFPLNFLESKVSAYLLAHKISPAKKKKKGKKDLRINRPALGIWGVWSSDK